MRQGAFAAAALILASAFAWSLPASGNGPVATVSATVTIASACLIASPSTVSFGLVSFSQPGRPPLVASSSIALHNCSPQAVSVLVRGSVATDSSGSLVWTLATPTAGGVCPSLNTIVMGVRDGAGVEKSLTAIDQTYKSLPVNVSDPTSLTLAPPCIGSRGGGQVNTVQYIFTAVMPDSVAPR